MAESVKPKVLIPFYSRSGTIERLALAVAEGAQSEGAEEVVKKKKKRTERQERTLKRPRK